MAAKRNSAKSQAAAEAWELLLGFIIGTRHSRDIVLEDFQLTPVDAKALHGLSMEDGKPMGALAGEWACDASNVTWMVDRLERRGLAERTVSPIDRRVKLVTLTEKGVQIKKELMRRMLEPPEELMELTRSDLESLRDALRKLPKPQNPPPWPMGGPGTGGSAPHTSSPARAWAASVKAKRAALGRTLSGDS